MQLNNNCDGNNCTSRTGKVRVLPYGGDGNLILCHSCYLHEMSFRRERNRELSADCRFQLPDWAALKEYNVA